MHFTMFLIRRIFINNAHVEILSFTEKEFFHKTGIRHNEILWYCKKIELIRATNRFVRITRRDDLLLQIGFVVLANNFCCNNKWYYAIKTNGGLFSEQIIVVKLTLRIRLS